MLLKQVNRTARIAWAPSSEFGSLLASGTIGGTIDSDSFETKSQLEVYDINLSSESPKMKKLGAITTDDSFQSIAWGTKGLEDGSFKHGLIAGGMSNGQVRLWDASAVMGSHEKAHVAVCLHKGQVDGLDFHPKQANLLAAGATDGEVLIWDLVDPYKPNSTKQNRGSRSTAQGVTALAWNQKVQHILASANEAGEILVYDVRNEKVVMTLKNAFRTAVKPLGLSWNPESSTQLGVCYEKQSVVELWDLRNAMAPKSKLGGSTAGGQIIGHAPDSGALDLAWCPHDQSVLLTTGQDQRHIAWDTATGLPLQYYQSPGPVHNLRWCPNIPSILASCSQDSKVSIESFNSFGKHVPKWLERPTGCSFGFGGALVNFGLELEVTGTADKKGTQTKTKPDSKLTVSSAVTEPQLVELAQQLQAVIKEDGLKRLCDEKVLHSNDEHERSTWRYIQILFEEKSKQKQLLLKELGFEVASLPGGESERLESSGRDEPAAKPKPPPEPEDDESFWNSNNFGEQKIEGSDDLGDAAPSTNEAKGPSVSLGGEEPAAEETEDEKAIREALIVADFKTAVNKCFQIGHYADALLLATCVPDLWEHTRTEYLKIHKNPFIKNVMRSVFSRDFRGLVDQSDLREWKQTLSVLMTYTKDEEYRTLVDRLAERLQKDENEELARCAIFCYMCSANIDRAVEIWEQEHSTSLPTSEEEQPIFSLHKTMEKIAVFARAIPGSERSRSVALKYSEYAGVLASQGNLPAALSFLKLAGSKEEKQDENADLIYRIEAALRIEEAEDGIARRGTGSAPVVAPIPASMPTTHATPGRSHLPGGPAAAPLPPPSTGPLRGAQRPDPGYGPRQTQDQQRIEQMRAEQMRAEQMRAEQMRAEQMRAEQMRAEQMRAEQLRAEQARAEQARAEQARAEERARQEAEQRRLFEEQRRQELARQAPGPYPTFTAPPPPATSSIPAYTPIPGPTSFTTAPSPHHTYISPPGRTAASPSPQSPSLGPSSGSVPSSPSITKPPATLTPEQNEVVSVFENIVNQLLATKPKPAEKKKIIEIQKRIAKLYHQFDKLSEAANGCVIELAASLKNRDYKTAEDKQIWLVTNEWQGNHTWLPGVKTLIATAKKLLK